MSFIPDPTKQAQEVIFSRKATKNIHPKIFFNNIPVSKADFQKHLGLYLDSKLSFEIHIKTITKISTSITFGKVKHELIRVTSSDLEVTSLTSLVTSLNS